MSTTQISAFISEETKNQVDAYVKRRGVKKAFLIENALQHHLQALRELPEDIVIPARLLVSEASFIQIAARLTGDEEPTAELQDLLRG